jgi:hypothetical protein
VEWAVWRSLTKRTARLPRVPAKTGASFMVKVCKNFEATPSNCGNILLGFLYRPLFEKAIAHHRETCGYGNNQKDRDNPQPSPKGTHGSPLILLKLSES